MSHQRVFIAVVLAASGCQLDDVHLGQQSASLGEPAIDLIAIGAISGTRSDRSSATSGALENGAAGNLLGGVGSGLAYAGSHRDQNAPTSATPSVPSVADGATATALRSSDGAVNQTIAAATAAAPAAPNKRFERMAAVRAASTRFCEKAT